MSASPVNPYGRTDPAKRDVWEEGYVAGGYEAAGQWGNERRKMTGAIVGLRDVLFDALSSMTKECDGPTDGRERPLFECIGIVLTVLKSTESLDTTDRSDDDWRTAAEARRAAR